jgi:hypothetical protein
VEEGWRFWDQDECGDAPRFGGLDSPETRFHGVVSIM